MAIDSPGAGGDRAPERGRWYAVQAQYRKEQFAQTNLENQGFEAFVPQFRRTVRHARQTRTVLAPLFPGYLFVRLDLARHRWRSVQGTFGVLRLVTDGHRPLPAPRGLVEAMMDMLAECGTSSAVRLASGDIVRILNGPFAELIGRLVTMHDSGRADVLLEMLGSQRTISVGSDSLIPAES